MNQLRNEPVERMLELIQDCEREKIAFQWLVYKMVKIMESIETGDRGWKRKWYDLWAEMKDIAINKIYEPGFDKARIKDSIAEMRKFLS